MLHIYAITHYEITLYTLYPARLIWSCIIC